MATTDTVEKVAVEAEVVQMSAVRAMAEKSAMPPALDSLVEGPVIGIQKSSVYIDLAPFGTGIIYGREFQNARDIIKDLNIGDSIK